MEVVLDGRHYWGLSMAAYEAGAEGRLHEVLSAACGD
jgi:hypothetical protein